MSTGETWIQELARKNREGASNVKVNVKPKEAESESNVKPGFDRKGYMMDYMKKYRKREKKCPYCGGVL